MYKIYLVFYICKTQLKYKLFKSAKPFLQNVKQHDTFLLQLGRSHQASVEHNAIIKIQKVK